MFSATPDDVRAEICSMKGADRAATGADGREWRDVKTGRGGIRDIEFVTQYLQLVHGRNLPSVRSTNTLDALVRLADHNILQADEYRLLSGGYVVLRTIEHALERMHNKQDHSLPADSRELDYLARRLDFPGGTEFSRFYDQHCRSIRRIFERRLLQAEVMDEATPPTPAIGVAAHLGDAATSYAERFSPEIVARHLVLREARGPGGAAGPGERRGKEWRPGGTHRDPRDRFKKDKKPGARGPDERRGPPRDTERPRDDARRPWQPRPDPRAVRAPREGEKTDSAVAAKASWRRRRPSVETQASGRARRQALEAQACQWLDGTSVATETCHGLGETGRRAPGLRVARRTGRGSPSRGWTNRPTVEAQAARRPDRPAVEAQAARGPNR